MPGGNSVSQKVRRRTRKKTTKKVVFDKYEFYTKAVQSPDGDVEFFKNVYKELRQKTPRVLREDFCGTGLLCAAWVKAHSSHAAFGVDLDPEPLEYGRNRFIGKLRPDQQKRIELLEKNVLAKDLPNADVSVGLNFSYFLFKTRPQMLAYFRNVLAHLKPRGLAFFDVFGGSQCQDAIEDRTKHKGFTYYWDQTGFDPVSNEAVFHIHFKVGGRKIERVFTYDWRLWSIPELKELMLEAGFKKVHVYWEGTARDGTGNGVFTRVEKGEACLSWIAYLVGEK
ncbi:MAG: class I SAM-dependent methyltransferase [Bdellovibrionaceae bacterium]|nr:class I SAM-dependent methyltransferase [Pseudobdellovibrionaceae bacterium]MBX3034465.1 class I SAM-dependent methyltransferase [Pseudobdellovibrionaceae bacterium]